MVLRYLKFMCFLGPYLQEALAAGVCKTHVSWILSGQSESCGFGIVGSRFLRDVGLPVKMISGNPESQRVLKLHDF